MTSGLDLLEDLEKRRQAANAQRQEWFVRFREKHGLPTHVELTVVHETGVVYEKDDSEKEPIAQADSEDLAGLAAIPSDENYVRWEQELLRQIAHADEGKT